MKLFDNFNVDINHFRYLCIKTTIIIFMLRKIDVIDDLRLPSIHTVEWE